MSATGTIKSKQARELPDDLNPDYLFTTTANKLLCDIVNGIIDPVALAKRTLEGRGYNRNGSWVGFGKEIK